jgi:hypothetical protein
MPLLPDQPAGSLFGPAAVRALVEGHDGVRVVLNPPRIGATVRLMNHDAPCLLGFGETAIRYSWRRASMGSSRAALRAGT